jgi:hypothetical protein
MDDLKKSEVRVGYGNSETSATLSPFQNASVGEDKEKEKNARGLSRVGKPVVMGNSRLDSVAAAETQTINNDEDLLTLESLDDSLSSIEKELLKEVIIKKHPQTFSTVPMERCPLLNLDTDARHNFNSDGRGLYSKYPRIMHKAHIKPVRPNKILPKMHTAHLSYANTIPKDMRFK